MSGRKCEFQIQDLINDYVENNYGVEDLCAKYHIGKIKVRAILKTYEIPMKKKGRQALNEKFVVEDYHIKKYNEPKIGYHYEVIDEKNKEFKTIDLDNKSGILTTYIEKTYGIPTPSLYDRQMYYMRTGNYWWEQWLKVVEVEDKEVKKCPFCDWTTKDITNRSGAFEVHLATCHGISKHKYIKQFPNELSYFRCVNPLIDRQFETDESKYVICKVCGRKLAWITDTHLKSHGMTKAEYMEKYGLIGTSGVTSSELHERLHNIAIKANTNMERDFSSQEEREIKEYITALGFENYTDRKILKGKELDIYIPSKHLAIEFNGNMWHSEKFKKDKTYHLEKLEECNKQGVKLIQIFEDEYHLNKKIVFSKIKHILGRDNGVKINAHKCDVSVIDNDEAEIFLNQNHIQGFSKSTIYLGAKAQEDGTLIGVMSFLNEGDGHWNLTRFATANGTVCRGVGSKMFNFFIKNFNPTYIRSFADRRWTTDGENNLYTKLGFKLEDVLGPDYRYYNPKMDRLKRFHKLFFKKDRLHEKYGFPLTMTEKEMMQELGYTRIWDCGLFKYVWEKKEGEE